jgi:pimeloyl-ACP methyl ester carboxylesterase
MTSAAAAVDSRRHRPAGRIRRRVRAIGLGALAALALVVLGFLIWANTPYRAERGPVIEVWANGDVEVQYLDEGILMTPAADAIDLPASPTGLVFVPGARVEAHAYMLQLSGAVDEHGMTVLITEPTLNLAFFDTRSLAQFTTAAPEVDRWFVGGHSLGGVRACLMTPGAEVEGLVLFGSYCANDLSDSGLEVLSIAGENDALSTPAIIDQNAGMLPADTRFVTIAGANHASFGDYGPQSGDGERTITSAQMRAELTALLGELLD